jgi:hypothetical protein
MYKEERMKVKIFQSDSHIKIGAEINKWLKKNKNIVPIEYLQSQSNSSYEITIITISVWYRIGKDDPKKWEIQEGELIMDKGRRL